MVNHQVMPQEVLYRTQSARTRPEIADPLTELAEQIAEGTVRLTNGAEEQTVEIPEQPSFEVELERLCDSETGEQRSELEFEIRWPT